MQGTKVKKVRTGVTASIGPSAGNVYTSVAFPPSGVNLTRRLLRLCQNPRISPEIVQRSAAATRDGDRVSGLTVTRGTGSVAAGTGAAGVVPVVCCTVTGDAWQYAGL